MDLREKYEKWAADYEVGGHINTRVHRSRALFEGLLSKRNRLLDIGSGGGQITLFLKESLRIKEAFSVDIAEENIRTARDRGIHAVRVNLDLEELPFEDEEFDSVFVGEVIEHLINPDHMLKEVHRVLNKTGVFILTTPNLAAWFNRLILLLGWQPLKSGTSFVFDVGRPKALTFGERQHLRTYTLRALKELLTLNGFEVVGLRGAPGRENEAWPHPWFLRIAFALDASASHVPALAGTLIVGCRRRG
jgi:methionine biosynthesis protein MetW